tara:strand:- start:2750 stop:2875 length:126 start_codon:yes stop_codon:yes gene_type:complete
MAKQEQTEFEKKVLEQFMSGKNLFGEGGAFGITSYLWGEGR